MFYTYFKYIIRIQYFGFTSGISHSATKKNYGINQRIVGYVEKMHCTIICKPNIYQIVKKAWLSTRI